MKTIDYKTEVCERWGDTSAYREHEQKTKNYTKEKWAEANDGLMAIFAEFAVCKQSGAEADSAEAQELVAKHRNLSPSFRRILPTTTTPALTRFSQVWARCTLLMNDSKRTSTSMERELQNLRQRG